MTVSLTPSLWVWSPRPQAQAQLRLFCLPYGGGDASLFHPWAQMLPPDMRERIEICPIQLPGHANRLREQRFARLSDLIDVLVPDELDRSPLFPFLDKPFAFFGAGLGGLIGFEIVHALAERQKIDAALLCVAACRPPHIPGPYGIDGAEHKDEELVEQIRADAMMASTYVYSPGAALRCPITVCGGEGDGLIPLLELAAWQAHTTKSFRLYTFPGDHFFLRDASTATRAQLLEYLARGLREVLPSNPQKQAEHDFTHMTTETV